jgi:hypothetical protein
MDASAYQAAAPALGAPSFPAKGNHGSLRHEPVHGWPQAQLRELLPDRMLAKHPELYSGDPNALPTPAMTPALSR